MEELRRSNEFPPKEAFYNTINQKHVDDDVYEASKTVFESKIAAGEWNNMGDYLKYYNLLDVEPLVEALSTCFDNYKKFFNVDAISR